MAWLALGDSVWRRRGSGGGVLSSNYSSHVTDNILRVGINYRFDSAVVAKY